MESLKDIRESAEDLFGRITEYIEARWNMAVLQTADKTADIVSSLAAIIILSVFGGMVVLFGSIALAWWIGESTGSVAAGFGLVALGYALITLVLFMIRDKFIKIPILNTFIKRFYYKPEEK
ncbi:MULTISPECIES: phage holin family protein [unclassified Siphonobacter]|uniref:phage holin family protein n=1 Tax=unclassified Siphonobacter TaxID=2635712 RepID=UPI000CBAF3AE|nr:MULTISPECIES: phage holin family protein [unclassified Siphonobacter]MDQ1086747.1 small-conductance mechanosensitive channel [Siphonobacter sp. SORGH_AS_1065]MDR6197010.1 small-conductance mechanosensitive channel [Siphonobacter sp. SORGH_AS_0500]PKK36254.1 hypothetical protein BWI96_12720 [Siphonobacter sp. SORGH_AS_0500]